VSYTCFCVFTCITRINLIYFYTPDLIKPYTTSLHYLTQIKYSDFIILHIVPTPAIGLLQSYIRAYTRLDKMLSGRGIYNGQLGAIKTVRQNEQFLFCPRLPERTIYARKREGTRRQKRSQRKSKFFMRFACSKEQSHLRKTFSYVRLPFQTDVEKGTKGS